MVVDIDLKIEKWKNKLLDLGKRNRLLNYKETKRSSLQIVSPNCISLWKTFVQDEKPLEFPYYDEFSTDLFEENINKVETNQTLIEMQKTLRSLRDKAKTANEEQGINILYLSFGFLQWKESKKSEVYFNSPILLVPVYLTVESIASPYILSIHEDEIVLNPTLCHKLENDFGIVLPEYTEDIDIGNYLETIRKQVEPNQWNVNPDVSLSLLSFLKVNMYHDLLRHKDRIKNNLVVRTIGGDATASQKIPEEIIDFDFDKHLKPTQFFQVVDADSSQQDAILCAKRGISFILQGPPGTGKSQTITNIISECLADGKKVLFVSEKMAALEVVHNRMTQAELDDFCLILHSHKANKRGVLDQLAKVLKMSEKKVHLSDEAYQKLDLLQADKEKLNDYANQLVANVMPLGKTIFDVNSILAHLEPYDEIIFSVENVDKIAKEDYNKQLYLLEQFSNTIGKMSEDYSTNPWKGANAVAVTNELRHDVGANLSALIPKIEYAIQRIGRMYEATGLQWGGSYAALLQLIPIFDVSKQSPIVPVSWVVDNEYATLFDEVAKCEQRQLLYWQKQFELEKLYQVILPIDKELVDTDVMSLLSPEGVKAEIERVQSVLSSFPYANWNVTDTRLFLLFEETREQTEKLKALEGIIVQDYEREVFKVDFQAMFNRYKTEYVNFFKYFKKSYRNDKKLIRSCCKTIVKQVTDEMVLDILAKLRAFSDLEGWFAERDTELNHYFGNLFGRQLSDFKTIENHFEIHRALCSAHSLLMEMHTVAEMHQKEEDILLTHYQLRYRGLQTNWDDIRQSLIWASGFKQCVAEFGLNPGYVESVCTNPDTIQLCEAYSVEVQTMLNEMDVEFQWVLSLFDDRDIMLQLPLPQLCDRLKGCRNHLFLLEEWIDFRNARANCLKEGLANYISKIEELHIDKSHIVACFKKRFFRLWLDAVLPHYPAVLHFRRRMQESTISEFAALDKLQFTISKSIIKSRLINSLPQMNHFTSGFDEVGVLKREMNKQRKIMPVRRLFREIPNLLLTLKPCLMMSPLSVSLFLEADTYMFDTVIFDEASQVCTENAIGAIFRGKQVIIAGDSKQLPPTNFFTASTSDIDYDGDDDDEDSNAYESILDEANLLPERTLLWHYRSRHEHLIAFSNAKIYRNSLITFPSNQENMKNQGVEYVYVKKGFYDRGGKAGNIAEAKKVAELVFEHFRTQANRSLGVIAFGEVQQQAIDTEIRSMRLRNKQFEPFFSEETDEPFFVKNLENVQGDERDTIIFSIGYAKDASGKMSMIFGPLSKCGGERRLNVAITRAKFNVKLVGSILPADIDVDRISSDGPKLLRGYIDFALNGVRSLVKTTTESDLIWHDSSFEKAVYNFLDHRGYKLATQVGCSGYRIDMAVKHPTLSGIYVIGIECDGASYHSARTARERDRLRQDVLENMGWKIYRIWSTDWIKDPATEGRNLLTAIDEAISTYGMPDSATIEKQSSDRSAFLVLKNKTIDGELETNPYQFPAYVETNLGKLPRNSDGYADLSDCVTEFVKNEFPLHYELLCQKIARLSGNQKSTVRIRRQVDHILRIQGNKIYRKGDFLYPSKDAEIIVKMPNTRNVIHISAEEIAVAMIEILSQSYGVSKDGLFVITRKVYGFGNAGQNISAALHTAFELLVTNDRVEVKDGKIVLCRNHRGGAQPDV